MPSTRDYFAAHAPDQIPVWFVHKEPKREYPPMPDYLKLDETHQQTALSWQRDGCFDLPEEIAWFGEKVTAHRKGKADWEDANYAARYFQWRFYYADMMIVQAAEQ